MKGRVVSSIIFLCLCFVDRKSIFAKTSGAYIRKDDCETYPCLIFKVKADKFMFDSKTANNGIYN